MANTWLLRSFHWTFEVFTEFCPLWLVATQMFSDLCELWELLHLQISVCLCSVTGNFTQVLNNSSRSSYADFWSSFAAQLPPFWNFAIQLLAVSLYTKLQMLSSARLVCSSWDSLSLDHGLKYDSRQKTRTISPPPSPRYVYLSSLMDHILPYLLSIAWKQLFHIFWSAVWLFWWQGKPDSCYRIVVRCGSQELTEGKAL